MDRPEDRAAQLERVSRADFELPARRQQERPRPSQRHRDDGRPVLPLAPKQKQDDGNQDHVEAGDEARVACGGVLHPRLLERACDEEEEAREEHPFELRFGRVGQIGNLTYERQDHQRGK